MPSQSAAKCGMDNLIIMDSLDESSTRLDDILKEVLGGFTPEEFVQLSIRKRVQTYERLFIDPNRIFQLVPSNSTPRIANADEQPRKFDLGHLLWGKHHIGDDGMARRQFAKEASEIFYEGNQLMVMSQDISRFLNGEFNGDFLTTLDIPPLVHCLLIIVDLDHKWEKISAKRKRAEYEETIEASELRQLSKLKEATVTIRFEGGGTRRGSDLKTQLKIRELSQVIRDLIVHFGDDVNIEKSVEHTAGIVERIDLKCYWEPPTQDIRDKVKNDTASLKELMQVQVAEWIKEDA